MVTCQLYTCYTRRPDNIYASICSHYHTVHLFIFVTVQFHGFLAKISNFRSTRKSQNSKPLKMKYITHDLKLLELFLVSRHSAD